MVYYTDSNILIRDMRQSDAQIITDEEIAQGWNADVGKYESRLQHQSEGKAISLVAEYHGNIAGYINIYPDSEWGVFAGQGYPEIVDFGVLEKYRRNGIGSKLMDVAEQIASKYADIVYLGVGMHTGYGSAQRRDSCRQDWYCHGSGRDDQTNDKCPFLHDGADHYHGRRLDLNGTYLKERGLNEHV